ncbi:PREDICTED: uncharacterized protein LOC106105953 [Papilio polytes]|uniref:uncharacterized protein LOC106105953 n=1 Tax=Papilio polytes TaxID=76194 RepID=UPI0006767EEE|nr:PREDICTED: uncharacterized protein LOC106105953 [Papilio polytes]
MPKLQIDEVFTKNSIHPMLINFQNGYTTGSFKPSECLILQDENLKTSITTQINDFVYTGEEEREDLSKTIIIAKNRNTGKVRLIEIGTAELKPVLKVDLDSTQLLETSNLELSRKFGSKKQKQQVEQREKLKVNVQIVNEQMQNVTQDVSIDNLDLSSYENPDSDDFYIPPINRDAQKPEQIYELDKILSDDDFEKIYSELDGTEYISDLPPWVANLMASKKNPKHIVLGVYAGILLKLYSMLVKDIPKKTFTVCKHSPTLNNMVLSNFLLNNNGKRSRPAPYKDKSLCHALIFLLLINNLSLDLDVLSQGIKLQPKTVTTKIRVTGASIIASGSKKLIQLKLPLKTKTVFRRKSTKF